MFITRAGAAAPTQALHVVRRLPGARVEQNGRAVWPLHCNLRALHSPPRALADRYVELRPFISAA